MKRYCLSLVAALLCVAYLSGCSLLPQYSDPARMEIDGQTFVTGFYDHLWPDGIVVGEGEPAAFESEYHIWWKVDGAPFELYCAQNKEALYWNPAIYCRESEFEEVEAYYADPENYHFYIGRYLEEDTSVLLGNDDAAYAERAIGFIMELDSTFGVGGIFDPFMEKTVAFSGEVSGYDRVTIYRVSKDGFFTTLHMELAVCDGGLYRYRSYDEQKDQTIFYRFDDDVSEHMVNLFERYELI